MSSFKYWGTIWPAVVLSLISALLLALGSGFQRLEIDTPPPYIDKYDWRRNFPADTYVEYKQDVLRVELWMAQCDSYERGDELAGSYSIIHAHGEPYGTIFKMDCRGNVEWPHGQELGAMLLKEALTNLW